MTNIFPDIRGAKLIGFDVEADDPGIGLDRGPGALRGEGELLGVGLATDDGWKQYYPIAHEDGENLDRDQVLSYVSDMLGGETVKVGANAQYDLEWLYVNGVNVHGPIRDIQIAQPLLDEEFPGGMGLENLGLHYCNKGKSTDLLIEAADRYGIDYKKKDGQPTKKGMQTIMGSLRKFHPRYVGPYCEDDSLLSLQIYLKQIPLLRAEDLWPIFELESRLTPMLLKMKAMGVRVDIERINQLSEELTIEEENLQKQINNLSGLIINPWSGDDIVKYFIQEGLRYKRTAATKRNPEGSPSFEGEDLERMEDPVCKLIAEWRNVNTMRVRYVENIATFAVNGRVHCGIHQLASDEGGARTGRITYSNFSLQKIPKRKERWRKLIRSVFLPEDGCFWGQQDYSQQEPRLGVHYAYLRNIAGAAEAVEYYRQPGSDFHTIVANMANIPRPLAKELNLGSWYGMGKGKMVAKLIKAGATAEDAGRVFDKYHESLPFVKGLLKDAMRFAERRGWVKTILGRRGHFYDVVPRLDWDTKQKQWDRYKPTRPADIPKRVEELTAQLESETNDELRKQLELDIKRWESGRYEVVGSYKALNKIIQGSAGDQTKKAMLDIYDEFGHVQYTQIQVHDELDGSYSSTVDLERVKVIMQEAIQLKVPVVVEPEVGPSWGEVKKYVA